MLSIIMLNFTFKLTSMYMYIHAQYISVIVDSTVRVTNKTRSI